MHGGTSRRGAKHPNYKQGKYAKDKPNFSWLIEPPAYPVRVYLFPWSELDFGDAAAEYIRKGGRLAAWILWPENTTPDVWARILRRMRREITRKLNELQNASAG